MLKKSYKILFVFSILIIFLFSEIFYLQTHHTMTDSVLKKKKSFVHLTGLPDLAIFNESISARHRSLNGIYTLYGVDGLLREYDKSSFSINKGSSL